MRLLTHVILSFVLAVALFPFTGWLAALIVFVTGSIVDIDHILWYYVQFNDLNLMRCRKYCYDIAEQRNVVALRKFLVIFHTLEFVALLAILSFFFSWAQYVLIGVGFHLILDSYDRFKCFGEYEPYSVIVFFMKYYKSQANV